MTRVIVFFKIMISFFLCLTKNHFFKVKVNKNLKYNVQTHILTVPLFIINNMFKSLSDSCPAIIVVPNSYGGGRMTSLHKLSESACVEMCLMTIHCSSVDYVSDNGTCRIYNKYFANKLIINSCCTHYEIKRCRTTKHQVDTSYNIQTDTYPKSDPMLHSKTPHVNRHTTSEIQLSTTLVSRDEVFHKTLEMNSALNKTSRKAINIQLYNNKEENSVMPESNFTVTNTKAPWNRHPVIQGN